MMASDNLSQTLAVFCNSLWQCWAINIGIEFALILSHRIVLERIAMHANHKFDSQPYAFCWPKIEQISALSGLSVSAVNHAIAHLKKLGIIVRQSHTDDGGKRHAKAFKLIKEPAQKPVASGTLDSTAPPEPAASGRSELPLAADATCRQRQMHIEELSEDMNLKNEARPTPRTRPPLAAPRRSAGRDESKSTPFSRSDALDKPPQKQKAAPRNARSGFGLSLSCRLKLSRRWLAGARRRCRK
ncbi:MAG: hypothetical protein ABUS57_02090 [Pseudomonadota bacterium]